MPDILYKAACTSLLQPILMLNLLVSRCKLLHYSNHVGGMCKRLWS